MLSLQAGLTTGEMNREPVLANGGETCLFRAGLYQLFANVYLSPPSEEFLQGFLDEALLEELSFLLGDSSVSQLLECFEDTHSTMVSEQLKQEYMALFAVPTGRYVTPFEDIYRGTTDNGEQYGGPLLGERAIAVKKMYREAGANMVENCKELPTHIGVELSFMSYLCHSQADVLDKGEISQSATLSNALFYENLQRRFLREHLTIWFPQLKKSINVNALTGFYRGMSELTSCFLSWDVCQLNRRSEAAEDYGS